MCSCHWQLVRLTFSMVFSLLQKLSAQKMTRTTRKEKLFDMAFAIIPVELCFSVVYETE
jgi:hypothetical protein